MDQPTNWSTCSHCGRHVHVKQWGSFWRCPFCHQLERLTVEERIAITFDDNSFKKLDLQLSPSNQLKFPNYSEKLKKAQNLTGRQDAIAIGTAKLKGIRVATGIMDNRFMVGTLNTEVGKALRYLMQFAREQRLPLLLFVTSGGARMQEGIFSLLQMNTILTEQRKLSKERILMINVLTDPTMGGASASFAFKSDYVVAEDHAQIGFSGKRVIEQATGEQLPAEFQTAEFLLRFGQLDDVIRRENIASYLHQMLILHGYGD